MRQKSPGHFCNARGQVIIYLINQVVAGKQKARIAFCKFAFYLFNPHRPSPALPLCDGYLFFLCGAPVVV